MNGHPGTDDQNPLVSQTFSRLSHPIMLTRILTPEERNLSDGTLNGFFAGSNAGYNSTNLPGPACQCAEGLEIDYRGDIECGFCMQGVWCLA